MQPARFRTFTGFVSVCAATSALLAAAPALAAPIAASTVSGAAPYALMLGAAGFGLVAALLAVRWRREAEAARHDAGERLGAMRAALDEFETLLAGMPEVTIIWRDTGIEPAVIGPISTLLPGETRAHAVLEFRAWLEDDAARDLAARLTDLRIEGRVFETSVTARDGRIIRATGRLVGGAAVVRLRPSGLNVEPPLKGAALTRLPSPAEAQAILANLTIPAWLRDRDGLLIYTNAAYLHFTRTLGLKGDRGTAPDIFDAATRENHLRALEDAADTIALSEQHELAGGLDLVLFPLSGGSAGYCYLPAARPKPVETRTEPDLGHLTTVIDALATPIAVFDKRRQLTHYNTAYARFWGLDVAWLDTAPDERAILDRLRTQGMLPAEADYRDWRSRHLMSYALTAPRETPWYLPDGRCANVIAAPATGSGGVIYVFEDMTERLALETRHNALIHVQRETLNALSEGVAVFGTNGRLKLHNPRLSLLWNLPMNALGNSPHIDDIAAACEKAFPEDGRRIWADLKQRIVDLNPTRSDTKGRIIRADGRLLDFAVVRLPDGQTMMTFMDVSESANYERVLKERNEALIAADRLKDTFVQNVSYELRSPLTNIIGFADLLASGQVGPLSDKQRAYTDYIRASSANLGLLIDNILDLATVDAGIAQLNPEVLDIPALIDKARAGLAATFTGGEKPVDIEVTIADDLPVFVADGTRIVQVLYNLLSNAARFSDPGSLVRVKVSARGAERIAFAVEDDGVGIPEDMRNSMFQRFEGQSVEGRQRGAGLGLAIVKTFANLHGGSVLIEGRQPRGTRVTVILPANAELALNAGE